MNNKDVLLEKMSSAERDAVVNACRALRGYESKIQLYLARFVASLCNVDAEAMLTNCNTLGVSQARWLFWYAYRLMTHETYEKISELTSCYFGKRFSTATIAIGINKISQMIEQEPVWNKRWLMLKEIIKLQQGFKLSIEKEPIKIVVPKGINVELKQE